MDPIDYRDKLVVMTPLAVLLAFPSTITVLSLVRGFSLSLILIHAKDCMDGFLIRGMACHEVKQLPCHSWFATSELMDECFIGHARDECSDHVCIHDIRKLIALLGKVVDVLT